MTRRPRPSGARLSRRAALRLGAGAALSGSFLGQAVRAATLPAATVLPEDTGRWSDPLPGPEPVIAIHAALLHTGEVLMVEGTTGYVWNPLTGEHRRADPPHNLFCSGHTVLDDGDVLFVGGHAGVEENEGPPWNHTFRPSTGTWTRRPDSRQGRWYPSATPLPDGSCLITGGTEEHKNFNNDVEVYRDGELTGHGEQFLQFFPLQHVLPQGRVLAVAPDGTGSTYLMDTSTFSFTRVGEMGLARGYPGSVLLPGGPDGSTQVMMVGGWTHERVPHGSTQVFDAAAPDRGWRPRARLPQARVMTNVVILPDGTLLAIGGVNNDGPQRQTLLYDPAVDVWKGLASQQEVRSYHSTALLLPDGRVLSAGDNAVPPGGGETLELFSPPYLFRGPRPRITEAPEAVEPGERFFVGTDVDVARAVLVRAGSTTHSFDMSQRHVELAFRPARGGVRPRVPGPNVAVPGWYLLFVLNGLGVPSVARWVHVARRSGG